MTVVFERDGGPRFGRSCVKEAVGRETGWMAVYSWTGKFEEES